MQRIQLDHAVRDQTELNRRFRAGELLDDRFHAQLEGYGCDVETCVLVSLVPDGNETYCGTIIRQDGRVFDFDLALGDPESSEWEDRTEAFLREYEQNKKRKDFRPGVVAYRMFLAEQQGRAP